MSKQYDFFVFPVLAAVIAVVVNWTINTFLDHWAASSVWVSNLPLWVIASIRFFLPIICGVILALLLLHGCRFLNRSKQVKDNQSQNMDESRALDASVERSDAGVQLKKQ